jgi:hypothetical protein
LLPWKPRLFFSFEEKQWDQNTVHSRDLLHPVGAMSICREESLLQREMQDQTVGRESDLAASHLALVYVLIQICHISHTLSTGL